jgi:hypothetical protein
MSYAHAQGAEIFDQANALYLGQDGEEYMRSSDGSYLFQRMAHMRMLCPDHCSA